MAGKMFSPDKCNDLANIMAIAITAKDDELSKHIAELSIKKNDALKRSRALSSDEGTDALTGWSAHELELKAASADIELRAIVQAKILSGDIKGVEAQMELARQIAKEGGSIAGGVELIQKLNDAPMADYGEIARLWGGSGDNATNIVTEIKNAIAEFTASNYSIRAYSDFTSSGVSEAKKLLKEKSITKEEFEKRMEGLHKEVMEKIAKGENPTGFVKLDNEWQAIKKVFKDNPEQMGRAWSQFIMARELLADGGIDDSILDVFRNMGGENLTGPLTMDYIEKCESLEELLARAYTNTEQLYKDGFLREAYREKLTRLASGMRLTEDNEKKVKSLINTMQFAEEGETFSNIVMKNKVYLSAKNMGLDVSKTDGTKLYNGLRSFAKSLAEDEKLLEKPIQIAGVDMTPADVIQLCYEITGDQNIIKLMNTGVWADGMIMSIATQKLLGMDRVATQNIIKLFRKGAEAPRTSNIRDITLLATTGINVRDGAKIGFFDSRKGLYYADKLSKTRADLMDKIAEKNKMRIDNSGIKTIDSVVTDADSLAEVLREEIGGGYLIVNDIKYTDNTVLYDAINKLTGDDAIEVLTPRGGMMANFSMEDGKLYYKTTNDDMFDDIAGAISIQSMGEARPTREILATAYEATTGKNGDRIRYQPSFSKGVVDSDGAQISDQQYEYFKNSKIRDANGNLLRVYHGTNAEPFDAFNIDFARKNSDIQGMFFSMYKEESEGYGTNIGEYYLNVERPCSRKEAYEVWASFEGQNDRGVLTRLELQRRGYDGVIINDFDEIIVFSPEQVKYVDNRLPTTDPRLKYMSMDEVDFKRSDSIEKLRDMLTASVTYDGKTVAQLRDEWRNGGAFGSISLEELDFFRILEATGDVDEAKKILEAERVDSMKYGTTQEMIDRRLKKINELDLSKLKIKKRLTDPKEIALAIFDYSIWSLDKSEIGNMVSKKGRINHKLFSKLTKEEQIEVYNRLMSFAELYEIRHNINKIQGIKEPYDSSIMDTAWRLQGDKRYYLRPNIDVSGSIGMGLKDFVHKLTDEGFLAHEVGIATDMDNNVVGLTVGNASTNWPYKMEKNTAGDIKSFHNHPNGSFFSVADMTGGLDKEKVKGLILPGNVIIEFPNTKELKEIWKDLRVNVYHKMRGNSLFENGIADAYETSRRLGIIDQQQRGVFDDIIKAQNGAEMTEEFKNKISDKVLEEYRKLEANYVDLLTPEGSTQLRWMRALQDYASQADMSVSDAMKVQLFTKDRTWEQIADAYGLPRKIVEGDMIEGVKAWGAWGNGLMYFTEMVKEGTCPHELYHAVFEMAGPEKYNKILDDAVVLFGYNKETAEEVLADAFAHRYKTGEFKYGAEAPTNVSKKRQKSFLKRVEDFFKVDVAGWLGLVDNHKAEVEQLFNDIVNCTYVPDANQAVNKSAAMIKYNKELNDLAVKYFGEMLGESSAVVDDEYIKRVQTLLSEKLNIDIKTFDTISNKSELWQKIDKQFTLDKLTAGKYDKTLVDINAEKVKIEGYNESELADAIKGDLGDLFLADRLQGNSNIELIREAYLDYKTAASAVDSLTAKGRIISLTNGVAPQTLTMSEIQRMFANNTFEDVYKNLFFGEQNVDEKTMKLFIDSINDDLFDGLSITFAENLVNAGYSLPLLNIKNFVYDYLKGTIDLNSPFVQAFFFKNNIPITTDNVTTMFKTLMPDSFKFDYESSLFKGRFNIDEPAGKSVVFQEVDNRFIPESYSALAAIEDARAGNLVTNQEKEVLGGILDKYIQETLKGMDDGSLTFRKAQELKQEASYALDMFEQDYLLPRYGIFLTPQQKQSLMGMKYSLPIGVSGQSTKVVKDELVAARTRLMENYSSIIGSTARNNDINMKLVRGYDKKTEPKYMQEAIERRRDQLINSGGIIKEVNGQFIVFNSKDALEKALEDLPDNIQGLGGFKLMGRKGIDEMSNKQAYTLLRYIEAAKGLATNANMPMELMYKQNPQLMQYLFFSTYRIDEKTGLPRVMVGNTLLGDAFFKDLSNTAIVDENIKKEIFGNVISSFRSDGYISSETLTQYIRGAINRQIDEVQSIVLSPADRKEAKEIMENLYTNSFIPYTYLRDIPEGGETKAGTFMNVKAKLKETMNQQYSQALKDLEAAGVDTSDDFARTLTIRLNDGSIVSMEDLINMDIDSWKKSIFNDENMFVKSADEFNLPEIDESLPIEKQAEIARQQKDMRDRIINDYNATIQSILNQNQIITEAEREAMTAFMRDVRTDLRKYSLTSKLVDALDAVSGLNEEASRGIKNYLIGFMNTISFGQWKPNQVIERYKVVKQAYKTYYGMSLSQLARMTPQSQADELAINLARYFKNLERLLGSADGLTGVTTDAAVNRAFYHIGEVFLNLDDTSVKGVKGIFGLLSAIEQNQVLKLFKYSQPGQASYVKEFFRPAKDGSNFMEGLGGYRDYVEEISGITRDQFNKMFGTGFDDSQFKRVVQGLSGFTLTSDGWGRVGPKILDILNGSNFIFRFLMSYPGQFFTIPQQGVAYFLKQMGHEKDLGIEDLSEIDEIRETVGGGILDGAYNELRLGRKTTYNPDDINPDSFYNRYGIPDTRSVYKGANMYTSDDYINMYAKIDRKYSKTEEKIAELIKQFDPYKDNANNFIDGMFARNFKNIAFVKGLKQNDFIQFGSARQFKDFMENPNISSDIKAKLLDRVAAYSGRNFRNILGLGFGGLDRAIGSGAGANIFFGIMQMFNFRGAWGQNIFKQTGAQLWNTLRWLGNNVGLSKLAKDEVAKAIATSPEWLNFTQALLNDLKRAWKLQRFQDNGRWMDEEEDGLYGFLDFLEYFRDTMNMTSQWYQGLQSFGPFRPIDEMAGSALASAMNPTIYKDTYGLGAFFNAWHKNFGRQWKPANWLVKAGNAYITDGASGLWAYFGNEFWNLSFGSLRYMINEDMNGYGYTYEVSGQEGGIPSIIMGESKMGSDKNFMYELDNTETWETIKEAWNSDNTRDERKVYHGNYWRGVLNASQLFSFFKNIFVGRNTSYFTPADLSTTIQKTPAGRELYQKGAVTPRDKMEAETFFKIMLNHSEYRPGSTSFNKSIVQFDDTGHMDGKNGHQADAEMELWLEHMKYKTNGHGEFVKSNGQKVVDPNWELLMADIRSHYGNKGYVARTVYNYSQNWLDAHSTDPNYQLYTKMLGQGQAHMLIETKIDEKVKALNVGLGKEDKWSEDEYKQANLRDLYFEIGNSVLPGDNVTFFERLNRLDQDDAIVAAIKIIESQSTEEDKKVLAKFFEIKKDDDGVENVTIKSQYKKVLTQIGNMARAVDECNPERLSAEMSSLAHMFKNSDPTGAITASMMNSIVARIYDSNRLSGKQKEELIVALFHDNKEFIQKNPEKMRELLGDNYDEYADKMNQMLYQWDGKMLSILEDITTSGEKSSGGGTSLSNLFKEWSLDLGGTGGSSYSKTGSSTSNYGYGDWVPVTIRGSELINELGLKGYTPMNVKTTVIAYKPHSDFSVAKDINRNVKGPKTQAVTKKKQLSKLESDTTKALEAES